MSTGKSQKPTPALSIGMYVFNAENYIEEAIPTLLNQTFDNFELLISDNASTDRTPEIIKTFQNHDSRIKVEIHKKNIGPANNVNFVLNLAQAPLFKWAAHDDLYAPNFLEKCVEILDQYPDVSLSYPKTWIIDADSNVVSTYEDNFHLDSSLPHDRFKKYLGSMALLNPFYGVIRTSILKKVLPLRSYTASDKVLLGEIALNGKFYEVPERLFFRRIHSEKSTVMNSTDKDWDNFFNPSSQRLRTPPRLQRFVDHIKSIQNSKLPLIERLRCYRVLFNFYLSRDRLPGTAKDLTNVWEKLLARKV